jgi:acetyl esterase
MDYPSAAEFGQGFMLDLPVLREWISWWAPEASAVPNPLLWDVSDMPPALVVTSELDPLRDGGERYAERLRAAGIPVLHRCEPGLPHNYPTLTHLSGAAAAADARLMADAVALLR